MHGKALINEALKGNPVERTPWVPYTGSQIANLKGYTAQEMFRDADKLYECCIEAESQYSPDGMTPMFDLQVEAEILGCVINDKITRGQRRDNPSHSGTLWDTV